MTEVVECNRCGECCQVGGKCELRRLHPLMIPVAFEGKCEFLADNSDGTTTCQRMRGLDGQPWFKAMVPGTCDFVELRKEIVGCNGV